MVRLDFINLSAITVRLFDDNLLPAVCERTALCE